MKKDFVLPGDFLHPHILAIRFGQDDQRRSGLQQRWPAEADKVLHSTGSQRSLDLTRFRILIQTGNKCTTETDLRDIYAGLESRAWLLQLPATATAPLVSVHSISCGFYNTVK